MVALLARFGRRRDARRVSASILVALLAACGGDAGTPTATATALTPGTLSALSGNGQSASAGSALAQSLVVRVSTSSGTPVSGVTVTFQAMSGTATLSATSAVTDASGEASTQVTLGAVAGSVVVSAEVQGTALATSFTVTAIAATASAGCAPLALAVGQAATASGSSICVTGGTAGAEFAIVPFNASTNAASRATLAVQPAGVTPVSTSLSIASTSATGSLGTLDASASTSARSISARSISARQAFERGLRARERSALTPQIAGARSWYAARRGSSGARLTVIPGNVAVGTVVSLNANAADACTRPSMRAGRVMAVGSKAIVVADTLNPAGGYTAAEYVAIAETFDTVVDAVDTKNFGEPTDIDGNGHVILFFTSAVNALTPRNAGYYVGGFFYSRDLFPTTATSGIEACAASNVGELFDLLVPDPSGTINGNTFAKSFVTSATIATTAHEYEHLINASRRLYVNTAATDFEETWLDEGLAHVAEELVFYARAGLTPLENLDVTTLRSSTTYRAAFNDEGIDNFGRLESFLENPSGNSPYADDDSLATRGATWSFLRYAVDQQSAAHETVWQRLVNSSATGLTNLRQVLGSDVTSIFRDWATSLLLDDVTGAAARYQSPSWNLRSIFSALSTGGAYPLSAPSLTSGTTSTISLVAGGAAYLRFGVVAGGTGSVSWTTTTSSNVQVTVVRLR